MAGRSYELQKFSGKVLIVRNQVYHKVHIEESKRDKDCGTCDKDTRAVEALEFVESIEKEDEKVENLVKKFKELGFKDIYGGTESFVQKDKTKKEIIKLLEEVAKQDFKDYYCFICVILSFGKDGVITCIPDSDESAKKPTPSMQLPVSELQECLKGDKCKGLLMKPKIFMLQLEDVTTDKPDGSGDHETARVKPIKIPREADFLIYNCETQYVEAWTDGLNRYVNDKDPMEIQKLLVRMNNIIHSRNVEVGMSSLPVPCVTSLLTKEVYLGKKLDQPVHS
ncbi:caspase-7-like isoform X2 [Ostrea edulis]|uniref:caspase-7-like isoform X2 n=1 Tax=Ostrea edulis TaxID=37623 RepID=UPI0024AF02E9|nr:caspase-7-like isoform X2 [Ostrea edulis]